MAEPLEHEGFRYPVRAGRPQTTSMPSPGDFVVITLNPLLSVAHLDVKAQREASQLRSGKYVALITDLGQGLPLKSKPTNEYYLKLVRDPWQPPSKSDDPRFKLPPHLAAQLAAPIHPHSCRTSLDSEHQAIKPVADFPCSECELDLSTGSICVRVTTSSRDCSQVLSVPTTEVLRLSHLQHDALEFREMLCKTGEFPAEFDPRPDPGILSQRFPPSDLRLALEALEGIDVKIPEGLRTDPPSSETTPDLDDTLRLFSALLKHPGNKSVPVVDVYYDLTQIETIRDPSYFLRERWELYQIVERATRRLMQSSESVVAIEKRKLSRMDSSKLGEESVTSSIADENIQHDQTRPTYAEQLRRPVSKRRKRHIKSFEKDTSTQSTEADDDKRPGMRNTKRSPPNQTHDIAWQTE